MNFKGDSVATSTILIVMGVVGVALLGFWIYTQGQDAGSGDDGGIINETNYQGCDVNSDCNDGFYCTLDHCVNGNCSYDAVPCGSGSICDEATDECRMLECSDDEDNDDDGLIDLDDPGCSSSQDDNEFNQVQDDDNETDDEGNETVPENYINLGFAYGNEETIPPGILNIDVSSGQDFDVKMIAFTSGMEGNFTVVEAILEWDPAKIQLLGHNDTGITYSLFGSGFIGAVDGINDDIYDGQAFFTAFISPTQPAMVPPGPDYLLITTLNFRAVGSSGSVSDIYYNLHVGNFAYTETNTLGIGESTADITSKIRVTI